MELTASVYEAVRERVRSDLGIELGPDRKAMVIRRLRRLPDRERVLRDIVNGDLSVSDLSRIANVLTTNHTHWWREAEHFTLLTQWLDEHPGKRVRIWCAASSTGEEPYTLWMASALSRERDSRVSILATDVSESALVTARQGVYDEQDVMKLPAKWRRRLFQIRNSEARVVDAARSKVTFRRFNLLTETLPFRQPFQVIFCRNVIIYFNSETRRQVVQRQVDKLEVGGLLCIGLAESLPRGVTGLERVASSAYRRVS